MFTLKQEGGRSVLGGVFVLLVGLMLVDVLPNMLKSLYTQYSQTLVFSYGVFALSFLGVMLAFIGMAIVRDLPAFFESVTFGWRTREAYLSGAAGKEKTKKTDKQTDSK